VDGLVGLLPLVGILLIFWLLIIRPASRRQRDQQRMQSELAVGDQVVLTSGFFGTLRALHDDRLEVELAPGTVVSVARAAVGSVVHDEPGDGYTDGYAGHDDLDADASATDEPGPSLDKRPDSDNEDR
jgi:preprotein translocase subunit YajC